MCSTSSDNEKILGMCKMSLKGKKCSAESVTRKTQDLLLKALFIHKVMVRRCEAYFLERLITIDHNDLIFSTSQMKFVRPSETWGRHAKFHEKGMELQAWSWLSLVGYWSVLLTAYLCLYYKIIIFYFSQKIVFLLITKINISFRKTFITRFQSIEIITAKLFEHRSTIRYGYLC